jgi:hypothetical protein
MTGVCFRLELVVNDSSADGDMFCGIEERNRRIR